MITLDISNTRILFDDKCENCKLMEPEIVQYGAMGGRRYMIMCKNKQLCDAVEHMIIEREEEE